MSYAAPNRVNDFVIKIATVNGTGSASANGLLMKAVFRSGVPVVGKNYFPSNIQGLPTWYEIRVTRDGHRARSGQVDMMVALNAETYTRDLQEVTSGGYFLYDSTWPRPALLLRDDVTVLGSAPHGPILQRASLVISHCGHGTTIKSLAAELAELHRAGPDVLASYLRNVRMALLDKAQQIYLEVSR